ncbi:MAG: protein-L-isoaspartate(D-aspartate) O-methyltransferase [Candidatus Delongbacteria bacterium]
MINFDFARKEMIKDQLKKRGIHDKKILEAFEKTPRHAFVNESDIQHAYDDSALPIGLSQTISQPYMVAYMTQLLKPKENDIILEIGTGSGFQAAILSKLCKFVISIERIPELATKAKKNISDQNIDNVQIFVGDGSLGWKADAPYDSIIVTAGAKKIPEALISQMKPGARMVIPVESEWCHKLMLIRKEEDSFTAEEIMDCVFVPLVSR